MISINAREKELITERFPGIHIVRTVKHKSKRHRYFCVETQGVMNLLAELRGYDDGMRKQGRQKRQKRQHQKDTRKEFGNGNRT